MSILIMPKAGQTMEEATLLHWFKQEGERVAKGEILLEIDTDKATVEVEAPEAGFLRKILCHEGTTVPVLTPIGIIATESADISQELARAQADLQKAQEAASETRVSEAGGAGLPQPADSIAHTGETLLSPSAGSSARPKASPAARKAAREMGVSIEAVGGGSGPGGRVLSGDVARAAMQSPRQSGPARRPLAGMRRAIARNMLFSKQNVPHFYMKLTIDAGPLYAFYRAEKEQYGCTITDILTLACARVIRDFPEFRSRLDGEEILEFPTASIGVAVGVDEGLVVPVLAGVESMSLRQLADESHRIIEAARQGKIVAMGQGVFTISNLGGFGVEEFSAIINPPEAGILAVGAIREAVVVKDEALKPARVMTMVLSADHRIVDGLIAARFLARLKEVLESPASLLAPVTNSWRLVAEATDRSPGGGCS